MTFLSNFKKKLSWVIACKLVTKHLKRSWKWSNGFCQMKYTWDKLKVEGCRFEEGSAVL